MFMRFSKLALVAGAFAGASGQLAAAQEAPALQPAPIVDGDSDEIIVTAQKREQNLRDVPMSVSVLSGAELSELGVDGPADLARVVSGFTYQNTASGTPVFTIRGIGLYDDGIGTAPTVSVYVDEVPLPYLVMTPAAGLDVARVEVLKGPQGTLFGQNSTGGAINYIAARPTSEFEGGLDLSYGRFEEFQADGFLSIPVSDTLGIRVSGRHEARGPWQVSQTRPDDELGRRDFSAGRILVDWQPSDALSVQFNANGWIDRSDTLASRFVGFNLTLPSPPGYTESLIAIGGRAFAPDDNRVADWDAGVDYGRDDWLYQLSARADWSISPTLTLTSITAHTEFSTDSTTDQDGTEFNNFQSTTVGDVESFFQELRLSGDFPFGNFTVGLNYQDDDINQADMNRYLGSNSGVGPFRYQFFDNQTDQQVQTSAVFASLDIPLTETLSAEFGARYTSQERDYQGCLRDAGDGALAAGIAFVPTLTGGAYDPAPPGGCVSLDSNFERVDIVTDSLDEDNLSWRAGLNWRPSANSLIYGNVTRGFKGGVYTALPAVFTEQLQPVTQEQVTAYEIGTRTTLFGGAADLTLAGFYYDYQDKQILGVGLFPIFQQLPQLQNIPETSVRGVEAAVVARPFEGLRVRAGATYVDSSVDASYPTVDADANPVDIQGESFPNTPEWQGVGDVEYTFPLQANLEGYVGGSFSYRSEAQSAFGENPTYVIDAYILVDLRAGLASNDGRWSLEVWGRNVFDEYYWTNVYHAVDAISQAPGLPATYGVTVRTNF